MMRCIVFWIEKFGYRDLVAVPLFPKASLCQSPMPLHWEGTLVPALLTSWKVGSSFWLAIVWRPWLPTPFSPACALALVYFQVLQNLTSSKFLHLSPTIVATSMHSAIVHIEQVIKWWASIIPTRIWSFTILLIARLLNLLGYLHKVHDVIEINSKSTRI